MGYCLNTVANFISSNFDFPSAENLSILGDMLPASNEVFNLGSDNMKWKDLYLSGETIYLGKSKISNDASSGISFRDEDNNVINLTVSSLSIQDPLQQNKKVTIQVDSDENVSNYVKNTSNNISTRLTSIENNVSNYIKNTSNNISTRLTSIENNVSNYVKNTSNNINKRITNIIDTIDNGLLFETISLYSLNEKVLSIADVYMKTRITGSGTIEFIHTFDVSVSINPDLTPGKYECLYVVSLFITYNEIKSFESFECKPIFANSIIDITRSKTLNNTFDFPSNLSITYINDTLEIKKTNVIKQGPIVNIISR